MKPNARIRRRLTAWYAGSVLVLLLVAVLSMRAFGRRALAEQHNQSVQRAVELVRSFFRAELSEYQRVDATLAHIAGELVFAGMGLDFLRPDSTQFAQARAPVGGSGPREPVRQYVVPLERDLAPGWQLRLRVQLSVETAGLTVSSRWARLKMTPGAHDYLSPLPPGSAIDQPLPERGTREFFGVVTATGGAVDWLELHASGHRRASFDAEGCRWLVP